LVESPESVDVLILGVTPELYGLPWPPRSTVRSADHSGAMIRAVWPGPPGSACVASWLDLPFRDGAFDWVLCDGGLHLLGYPRGQRELAESLVRVLRPGGGVVLRLYARPRERESAGLVFRDLSQGEIRSVHALKLRLWMALQRSPQEGVLVRDVHRVVLDRFGSLERLAAETGWPEEEVLTLACYEDSTNRYYLTTVEESVETMESGGLVGLERHPERLHHAAEHCPVVLFRKEVVL
jgi:SAM-dependent methyltransferase